MIEEKLMELQYQLQNVQVIVQGKNDGAVMFLVNESGVIKCDELYDESAHVLDNQNGITCTVHHKYLSMSNGRVMMLAPK